MNIITGHLLYDDNLTITVLNDKPYDINSGFCFKKTKELTNALSKRIKYIEKITFKHVTCFNTGDAIFLYLDNFIHFTIINMEYSFNTCYKGREILFYYDIKSHRFFYEKEEVERDIFKKYPEQVKFKYELLDEIDMLLTNISNEISLKKSLIDSFKKYHVIEVKGYFKDKETIIFEAIDITKTEEMNQKALQAEKLQALGFMAGEIAHELNNQLMVIDGNVELAMKEYKVKKSAYFDAILATSSKSSHLIKSLLTFSNEKLNELAEFSLEELYKEFLQKTKYNKVKNYQLIKNIDLNLDRIHLQGSLNMLVQTFLNIYNNALEAFSQTDNILILNAKITYLNTIPKNAINKKKNVCGKYLKIDLIDNGMGIDYDIKNRIFDPFFTTKDKNKNTGLGLTQSLGTIIKHEGILELYQNQMGGTTVSIYLPCKEDNRQMSFDFNTIKTTILVVDDDKTVLLVLEGLLKELKYEVIIASSAYEAIAIYEENYQNIDLVLSDMIMPKMNGEELYHHLKVINPLLKFILLSGYTKNMASNKMLQEISAYLEKPIRKKELELEINKTLKDTLI